MEAGVGPGTYDVQRTYADVPSMKHQHFGTTQERFKDQQTVTVGPGTYESKETKIKHKYEAAFRNTARDGLFKSGEQSNMPGPGHYKPSEVFKQKLWSSNVGAFDQLEARFTTLQPESPGPARYELPNKWLTNQSIVTARLSATSAKSKVFKKQSIEASFASKTERSLQQHIKRVAA